MSTAGAATVRRRACAVSEHAGQVLLVRLLDPASGVLRVFPPGGAIEPGESAAEAALREAFEETGYRLRLADKAPVVEHYPYAWNGVTYACETAFFRCVLDEPFHEPGEVVDASYHRGVLWLPRAELAAALSFSAPIARGVSACLIG